MTEPLRGDAPAGLLAIEVRDLRMSYRTGFMRRHTEVLRGVSFSVPRASITGYLGVNGAGKTTTIKVLVGINAPVGGEVRIFGLPAGSRAARARTGFMPESAAFYDALTARELLDFYGRLSGIERAARARLAETVLAAVDLADAASKPVRTFSKGMRQRLGLAQALLHGPDLLVLDEPLDGLDALGRLKLRETIVRERERGLTIFFSSHVLSDVEAICDHLVILDGGRVAYEGTTRDLLARTRPRGARIRFADAPERLAQALEREGIASTIKDGCLVVDVRDPGRVDLVIDRGRGAGAHVVEVDPIGVSLEEYFLETFAGPRAPGPTEPEAPVRPLEEEARR